MVGPLLASKEHCCTSKETLFFRMCLARPQAHSLAREAWAGYQRPCPFRWAPLYKVRPPNIMCPPEHKHLLLFYTHTHTHPVTGRTHKELIALCTSRESWMRKVRNRHTPLNALLGAFWICILMICMYYLLNI